MEDLFDRARPWDAADWLWAWREIARETQHIPFDTKVFTRTEEVLDELTLLYKDRDCCFMVSTIVRS